MSDHETEPLLFTVAPRRARGIAEVEAAARQAWEKQPLRAYIAGCERPTGHSNPHDERMVIWERSEAEALDVARRELAPDAEVRRDLLLERAGMDDQVAQMVALGSCAVCGQPPIDNLEPNCGEIFDIETTPVIVAGRLLCDASVGYMLNLPPETTGPAVAPRFRQTEQGSGLIAGPGTVDNLPF